MKMVYIFRYMIGYVEFLSLRLILKFIMIKLIYKEIFLYVKVVEFWNKF